MNIKQRLLGIFILLIGITACQSKIGLSSEKSLNNPTSPKLSHASLQQKAKSSKVAMSEAKDVYYQQAYQEITAMLVGKQQLSFKRAAFLVEWAHFGGNLSYDQFCADINEIVLQLHKFIDQKGVRQYQTAGNYALFEFFTKPHSMNGNQPFTYDFIDFYGGEDWSSVFVTKLLKTHKGQCRSLPYLYRILAEEMNAAAHLAIGPNHCYIKHIGEDGKWVNVELTNGNFATDAWMISSMDISAEAIKNKIYMDALSLQESVAYCLSDLAQGYARKYDRLDNFIIACCDATLQYYPHSIHTLILKYNTMNHQGLNHVKQHGYVTTPDMAAHHKIFKATERKIDSLGFRQISQEKYEAWAKSMEAEEQKTLSN